MNNQKYDMMNYGNSESKKRFETKPGLLGSKGDLGSAQFARSAEKHKGKLNYPLI